MGRASSPLSAVAVSDANVFWSETDGLKSCPKTGCAGTPNVHSTESGATGALAFDGSSQNLFFASCCPTFFDSYSAAGGRLSHVPVASSIAAIGIDADNAYWNEESNVVRATRTGASPAMIAGGIPGRVRSFAIDTTSKTLYAACTGNQGAIIRIPVEPRAGDASSQAWTLVTNAPNPSSIALANGNLYFAFQGTSPAFNDGGVRACALNGCAQPTALFSGRRATAVIASATSVYFIAEDSVYTCPLSGCGAAPTLLSSNSANTPDGQVLAQDARALYWISTDGTVKKLAK